MGPDARAEWNETPPAAPPRVPRTARAPGSAALVPIGNWQRHTFAIGRSGPQPRAIQSRYSRSSPNGQHGSPSLLKAKSNCSSGTQFMCSNMLWVFRLSAYLRSQAVLVVGLPFLLVPALIRQNPENSHLESGHSMSISNMMLQNARA
jgi:hypothetical protein